jgi:hypothetical protein
MVCFEDQKRIFLFLFFREDLLTRPDPINEQFLNSFVILTTHYLVGGLTRGLIFRRKKRNQFFNSFYF